MFMSANFIWDFAKVKEHYFMQMVISILGTGKRTINKAKESTILTMGRSLKANGKTE